MCSVFPSSGLCSAGCLLELGREGTLERAYWGSLLSVINFSGVLVLRGLLLLLIGIVHLSERREQSFRQGQVLTGGHESSVQSTGEVGNTLHNGIVLEAARQQ